MSMPGIDARHRPAGPGASAKGGGGIARAVAAAAVMAGPEPRPAARGRPGRPHRPPRPLRLHLRRPGATPAIPATRWPRRCSPTACAWSAARSSTTGRAASSPPGRRSRTRWSSCAAARGASPTRARPPSSSTTGSSPRARTAGRRCASTCSRVNQLVSRRSLGAGFYYKTFMWPASFWEKVYEPLIRRAAGLGRAAGAPDPDHYEKAHAFCDVLVIGGGPAGLAAALAAGRAGARVILCEEDFRLGGRLLAERREIDGRPRARLGRRRPRPSSPRCPTCRILRADHRLRRLRRRHLRRARARQRPPAGPPAHEPRQRLWRIVAKRAVLAAGAIERPLVFGDNDRPGVMLAGAVRTYRQPLSRVAPGGARWSSPTMTRRPRRSPISRGRRRGRRGRRCARRGLRRRCSEAAEGGRRARWSPAARVTRGAGRPRRAGASTSATPSGRDRARRLRPGRACRAAGRPTHPPHLPSRRHAGVERAGWRRSCRAPCRRAWRSPARQRAASASPHASPTATRAGADAAPTAASRGQPVDVARRRPREHGAVAPLWRVRGTRGKAFVDFQNDVTDVGRGARRARGLPLRRAPQALHHARHGDRPGQDRQRQRPRRDGRADRSAPSPRSAPPPSARPSRRSPIGALAGHHRGKEFRPTRLTPSHRWAEEQGAVFVETGVWLRAQWYPQARRDDWLEASTARCDACASAVGICDVSTLGKIDVQGADAGDLPRPASTPTPSRPCRSARRATA